MKIKVSGIHLEKVKALRDELSGALGGLLKSNRELDRLSKHRESLRKEIEAMEKSASFDKKDEVQALGQKRIELELVTSKLSQIPGLSQEEIDPIQNLMRQTDYAVAAALMPTLDNYAAEIAKLLRPYCPNDNWAIGLARQTPASMSLGAYCTTQHGRISFGLPTIQAAIKRCDEVLAGELTWKFNSNPA